jgi:hypothetical protein
MTAKSTKKANNPSKIDSSCPNVGKEGDSMTGTVCSIAGMRGEAMNGQVVAIVVFVAPTENTGGDIFAVLEAGDSAGGDVVARGSIAGDVDEKPSSARVKMMRGGMLPDFRKCLGLVSGDGEEGLAITHLSLAEGRIVSSAAVAFALA